MPSLKNVVLQLVRYFPYRNHILSTPQRTALTFCIWWPSSSMGFTGWCHTKWLTNLNSLSFLWEKVELVANQVFSNLPVKWWVLVDSPNIDVAADCFICGFQPLTSERQFDLFYVRTNETCYLVSSLLYAWYRKGASNMAFGSKVPRFVLWSCFGSRFPLLHKPVHCLSYYT